MVSRIEMLGNMVNNGDYFTVISKPFGCGGRSLRIAPGKIWSSELPEFWASEWSGTPHQAANCRRQFFYEYEEGGHERVTLQELLEEWVKRI